LLFGRLFRSPSSEQRSYLLHGLPYAVPRPHACPKLHCTLPHPLVRPDLLQRGGQLLHRQPLLWERRWAGT
jgi:hypothetical protein